MKILALWLFVGLFSFHGNNRGDVNDEHDPIGIQIETEYMDYGYVHFVNSFYEQANILYVSGHTDNRSWRFNYIAGIVEGYCNEILPALYPTITFKYDNIAGDIGCLPNSDSNVNCVATLRIRLW